MKRRQHRAHKLADFAAAPVVAIQSGDPWFATQQRGGLLSVQCLTGSTARIALTDKGREAVACQVREIAAAKRAAKVKSYAQPIDNT